MKVYRIALIGSSGGGGATLSSCDIIIQSIVSELKNIVQKKEEPKLSDIVVLDAYILTISRVGFDFINQDSIVELQLSGLLSEKKLTGKEIQEGPLSEINNQYEIFDKELAELIMHGKIDGLISISSDPEGVNRFSIEAAIQKQIPVVGTG